MTEPKPNTSCWRSECASRCYYPDVCSERPRATPTTRRETEPETDQPEES